MLRSTLQRPLTALIASIADGRFLKLIFLAMLAVCTAVVIFDYQEMSANAAKGIPGSQKGEPTPIKLPVPGDQTRPYLPKTMPLGPGRHAPSLPGYFGPLDGTVMAAPMTFHFGDGDKASAIGTIDAGAAKRLAEFLATHDKQISEISLHSPGGSVADALAMTRMIRNAGISTRVPEHAYCASSCPLLLAGGLYRKVGKGAFVGVHQVYAVPPALGSLQRGMADAQTITAACQQALIEMGVDLNVWVRALATPPDQLYLFTSEELARYRLANYGTPVALPVRRPVLEEPANG